MLYTGCQNTRVDQPRCQGFQVIRHGRVRARHDLPLSTPIPDDPADRHELLMDIDACTLRVYNLYHVLPPAGATDPTPRRQILLFVLPVGATIGFTGHVSKADS